MAQYIKKFTKINISDLAVVGGKNASLGEMITHLTSKGINVPDGFATTSFSFWAFLDQNGLRDPLKILMNRIDKNTFANLSQISAEARKLILEASIPDEIRVEIINAYQQLCGGKDYIEVAVRSSATAEDLPTASFAGQHESYLNIKGEQALIKAVQNCYASLYTNRAIKYREDKIFAHDKVALSVGVQKMVRSDRACFGVGFTLEPESGFRYVIHLSGVWGLGENIVQGTVTPDEFLIFKPTLIQGKNAIIQKRLGEKAKTMIYAEGNNEYPVINIETPKERREQFVLDDNEILQLAHWALLIEQHYDQPMDIEWAKDGTSGQLYIIQARPETVHSQKNPLLLKEYHLLQRGELLASGSAVGNKITTGIARVLHSPKEADKLKEGEIVVTESTSPDWDPVLKKSAAIITDKGGRTSHASIVARELGVPAIVGCGNATQQIEDGSLVTVSCCEGKIGNVYKGDALLKGIENILVAEEEYSKVPT